MEKEHCGGLVETSMKECFTRERGLLQLLFRSLVDTDVTLTLKNLRLKTTRNWRTFPALKLTDSSSRITFDNVEFAASDDFYFYNGRMYVHNDFVFTGTHSFIYKSDCPCFIEPRSTFHMEPKATFYYDTILLFHPE